MPWDPDLAQRVREELASEADVIERQMFGGLAFLLGGHMTVAASSHGGLMVRVSAQRGAELASVGPATQIEMQGRPMRGWLHVDGTELTTDRELTRWVGYARDFVRTLPPKSQATGRRKAGPA